MYTAHILATVRRSHIVQFEGEAFHNGIFRPWYRLPVLVPIDGWSGHTLGPAPQLRACSWRYLEGARPEQILDETRCNFYKSKCTLYNNGEETSRLYMLWCSGVIVLFLYCNITIIAERRVQEGQISTRVQLPSIRTAIKKQNPNMRCDVISYEIKHGVTTHRLSNVREMSLCNSV